MLPEEDVSQLSSRKDIMDDQRRANMDKYLGKVRPQILAAILLLGLISILGMFKGMNEVTVGCIAGIIALAKDVLQVDSN
jgi:hypothetical protein|tara:strand:- start:25 stop:264 length:240 start_codon:yes stop_codon:yes gene_type:complete